MSNSKKHKADDSSVSDEIQKRAPAKCILHATDIQHGDFTPLTNVKGSATDKLAQLHNIREKWLLEPQDSPYRMEEVCNLIPESLAGRCLEVIGYHRGCYQHFTKNMDRLKDNATSESSTSRSPRKPPVSILLFPPECISVNGLKWKCLEPLRDASNLLYSRTKKELWNNPLGNRLRHEA